MVIFCRYIISDSIELCIVELTRVDCIMFQIPSPLPQATVFALCF